MNFLKKYWIAIAIILVLLIVAIFYFRKRSAADQSRQIQQTGYRQTFTVGRFDHKAGTEVAVTLAERPPMGTIVEGDTIVIDGSGPYNGTYTVKSAWEDGGGQLGALFIDVPESNTLPDDTKEYAYANVGKIHLV